MKRFLSKTFGGLETSYYLRHLFFGLAMTILFSWGMFVSDNPAKWTNISAFVAFGVLYPYSRFVYESVLGFVFGENVFFVNAFLLLITKIITMVMCWVLSIFIAPIGFIWLYFHNSKKSSES
ncbi:TPA: hypothetical protein KD091_004638 [Vibrio parahaemolyticus]|nr:hypothetical protein [Vibrio parahaemolyticus]